MVMTAGATRRKDAGNIASQVPDEMLGEYDAADSMDDRFHLLTKSGGNQTHGGAANFFSIVPAKDHKFKNGAQYKGSQDGQAVYYED